MFLNDFEDTTNTCQFDVQAAPGTPVMNNRIVPTELAIDMKDIRLVLDMKDEENGLHRDYVVGEVIGGPPYIQKEIGSNLPRHTRYVDGTNHIIPWPTEEIERLYSRENDTLRILVNEDTYIPSLTYSPIEEGVIDELRGKYSRTRKIHDDVNWVRKKVLEDARESWLERRVSTMMTREKKTPELQPMKGTKKWMEVQKQVRELQSKSVL